MKKQDRKSSNLNVAEAKRRLSDLLGRVAYGKESFVITKRGKPMARLVPMGAEPPAHLGDTVGWVDGDDPFFTRLDEIIAEREGQVPRAAWPED